MNNTTKLSFVKLEEGYMQKGDKKSTKSSQHIKFTIRAPSL